MGIVDDRRPADPPCGLLRLKGADLVAREPQRGRRDERLGVLLHARDQRLDERGRGQQRVPLEVDDQVEIVQLPDRLGAPLGSVAALRRGHDHPDAVASAGIGDALVVGGHEHPGDAGHAPRRVDAAQDQRLARALCSFQLDQRLPGVTRRSVARRDQDYAIHRAAGQS